MRLRSMAAALLALAFAAPPAHAVIPLGAQAPNFTKNVLGGGSKSLSDYPGRVVVLFLLGYA